MKKILFPIFAIVALLSSCEEDLPLYSDQQAYLNFDIQYREDTLVNYSFAFSGGKQKDTVWIKLKTMGYLSDKPRQFKLKQIPFVKNNAEPGKHYVALNSKEIEPYLVVPANAVSVDVPIILLRDPSLDDAIYNLRIVVEPNGTFMPGYQEQNFIQVTITNKLNRPSNWSGFMNHYFGKWGPVKHQFMMDVTGKKWDAQFLQTLFADQVYTRYLQSKLKRALEKLNNERKAEGKPMLKEADGTLVTIGK